MWSTLGEVGTWQSGGTPSRSNKTYYGGSIPWLKTGDLNDGLVTSIPESITQEGLENSSAKLNPKGSVLIAMYGATIGKIGILDFPATTNQACCACIDYPALKQRYLFLFLLSHKEEFISQGGGGAQPNISKEIIIKTPIPIPPINEQERIVIEVDKFLDIFKNLEECESGLIDSVSQIKKKILELAISGKLVSQDPADEPAADLLKRVNPNAVVSADTSHYQHLPQGWCVCKLEDIVDYEQPQRYIVESTDYNDTYKTPVLTAGKSFVIGYTNEKAGIFNNLPVIIFDDFTTDSKYVDFPFKVKSSAMKILHVKNGVNVKYVYYFMSITRLVGKTHKRYWISEYSKLNIPLPPYNEQCRIVDAVENTNRRIDDIAEAL